jgi:hypothetical protein
VENDSTDAGRIEELIHLGIVRENQYIGSEPAVVADAYQKAMTAIDLERVGKQDILPNVHTHLPKLIPASCLPSRLQSCLETSGHVDCFPD